MKFNNREQIKEILAMNITNEEKKELIAQIKNVTTDLARVISVDEELKLEEGAMFNNLNKTTSWTDTNKDNSNFNIEIDSEIEYLLTINNVKGYEVQYLDFQTIYDELEESGMDEDEAEELADEIANDEVYLELMDLLGSDADMKHEAEILVSVKTQMEIVSIADSREDEGYINIELKEVK